MGTRSLTKIIQKYDDGQEQVLTTMYRQMDGYPELHGIDLATWLYPFNVVNGIGLDEERQIANVKDCLCDVQYLFGCLCRLQVRRKRFVW